MENFNNDELSRRRADAEQELYEMHSRSAMPPVPPFVRTPTGGSFENGHSGYGAPLQSNPQQNARRPFRSDNRSNDEKNEGGNASHYIDNENTENKTDGINDTDSTTPKKRGTLFGKDLLKIINLKDFEMDSDRMLLLLMILLLSENSSDEILLLALAYLML